MGIQLKNNAVGYLATAISASDVGLVLQSGNGANFPSLTSVDYFYATLESSGGTSEIVKVTARSGDSLTIVRAQEGTTANSFAVGSRFELRVTAQSVKDIARYDQWVSVKDFGATGDGVTDDTTFIVAALASGSKNVYFPRGQYKTTATINRPTGVRMYGDGSFASTIVAYHNNSIIRTAPAALSGDSYNSMEDMGVKNGTGFHSAIGIELENLNQPSFKRIRIEQGPVIGMRQIFVLNGEFEEISIIDCTDVGLYLFSTGLATGTNRNVFQCMNMTYNARGIVVILDGGLNNVFNDVAIEACTSYPVEIVDCDQITFNGLYLEGNAQSIWCRGGDFVTFRDCFNVSAIPFIRQSPFFNTTRVQVERLFDLSAGGVGTNGNYMGQEYGRIHFPSTAVVTTEPNTLDDYEEGEWVPTDASGAGLTLSAGVCRYTKIGRMVQCNFNITYPVTANGAACLVGGLPFISKGFSAVSIAFTTVATVVKGMTGDDEFYFLIYNSTNGRPLNSDLSNTTIRGTIVYETNV